jgi:hypothetical protein
MNVFERLTKYYQTQPPRLSFGGSEGSALQMRVFDKYPDEEATKPLGITVWRHRSTVNLDTAPIVGYCMVDVCLDFSGWSNPDALHLPLEMQNHELEIVVYLDRLDCIRMRAIGGYSPRV